MSKLALPLPDPRAPRHRAVPAAAAALRRAHPRAIAWTFVLALALAASRPAVAEAAAGSVPGFDPAAARAFVLREAGANPSLPGARLEVEVGEPDPRLRLAPCARSEYRLPRGARLWGRTYIGLHCRAGASWAVQVPVTVRVFGPALVAARPLAAGQPIAEDDVREAEVEWTRQANGLLTAAEQLAHRVPVRSLAPGEPIEPGVLRVRQVVGAGEPVRVLGVGQGFTISLDGVALNGAGPGESVRVRTDSGRVINGFARGPRAVEVPL